MDFIPLNSKKRSSSISKEPKKFKNIIPSDPKLVLRVKKYMLHNPRSRDDIDQIIDGLLSSYGAYQRKKKNAFKIAVTRAHDYLSKSDLFPKPVSTASDDSGDSFDSELSIENEAYSKCNDNNVVNKSLQDLYTSPKKFNLGADKAHKKLKKIKKTVKYDDSENFQMLHSEDQKQNLSVEYSTVTFADIGACDTAKQDICQVLVHFKNADIYAAFSLNAPTGVLLHGPPGSGKTLLAYAIAGELQMPFFKLAATELVSGVSGESEEQIRKLFDRAAAQAPCIIFIDEIDAIGIKRETAQREMERRMVTQLKSCMDGLSSKPEAQLLVIGATSRPDSLDPALRRAGRFDREICLGIPDEKSRLKILQVLCRKIQLHKNCDLKEVARNTPGFVGADLNALVSIAAKEAIERIFSSSQNNVQENGFLEENIKDLNEFKIQKLLSLMKTKITLDEHQMQHLCIEMDDMQKALKLVQPSAKREGFATVPDVSWEDVGALKDIREELELFILAPIRHPEVFEQFGLNAPAGILLCGPPGCGKTLIAKAIANETGVNFISVKGPELLNMYVGESERAVRQCFQRARNSSPCIIFFDELDSLCPRRSETSENAASSRVVNQLLTEMDGIDVRKGVYIIGATNRPDIIDPAVLRPGRLDKTLYVGLPTASDRVDIFNALTKNGQKPPVDSDVCLTRLAEDERCSGFTGADLAALVREASMVAIKNIISGLGEHKVSQKHFDIAFQKVKPSVSAKDCSKYEEMHKEYCHHRS